MRLEVRNPEVPAPTSPVQMLTSGTQWLAWFAASGERELGRALLRPVEDLDSAVTEEVVIPAGSIVRIIQERG